jgi:polyisoprenoid-binding protein YceI
MSSRIWKFDLPHCNLQFIARHMVVAKVVGRFDRFDGTLTYDPEKPATGQVHVDVETASVNTNSPDRDTHLRSPDFLDVSKAPKMTFKSTSFVPHGPNTLKIEGELTLRNVTKPVTLEVRQLANVTDPWGKQRLIFNARTTLTRADFGLTWNKALDNGGWLVSERIELDLDVQAVAVS